MERFGDWAVHAHISVSVARKELMFTGVPKIGMEGLWVLPFVAPCKKSECRDFNTQGAVLTERSKSSLGVLAGRRHKDRWTA